MYTIQKSSKSWETHPGYSIWMWENGRSVVMVGDYQTPEGNRSRWAWDFFWMVFSDELFLRRVKCSWFFPRRTETLLQEKSPCPVLVLRFRAGLLGEQTTLGQAEQLWRQQLSHCNLSPVMLSFCKIISH